ncbi:MAG: hypothetical protein K6T31_01415 [Alicyclobacillus sp.]|nr:hypothetical protein [Alicyclobacillus sp.]
MADAFAYLAHACPEYTDSAEQHQLRLDHSLCQAMAAEGQRLFTALTDAVWQWVVCHWQGPSLSNSSDPSARIG